MMCVKLTLPPRVRIRWLLRILRLTSSSRAGTCRKLVAVGTVSDCSMFTTVLAAAPRRTVAFSGAALSAGVVGAAAVGDTGFSATVPPLVDAAAAGAAGEGPAAAGAADAAGAAATAGSGAAVAP